MGTKEEVIEFLKSEHDKYEVTYKTWCALNPGYIMHNDSIRIMVLENIISTIIKESSARYSLFRWDATDNKWWLKTSAVDKLNELLK